MDTSERDSHRGQRIGLVVVATLFAGLVEAQTACPVTYRIHDVQGGPLTQRFGGAHNDVSPLASTRVTIEGVVVAAYQGASQLRGFFVQEEQVDEDADPATSEGLFVSTGSLPPVLVAEGQRVCVSGSVSEYFGMTQISAFTAGSVQIVSAADHSDEVLPAEIALPVSGDLDDFYERYEGMLVRFPGDFVIADLAAFERFGEVALLAGTLPQAYTQTDTTPTAAEYAGFRDALARRRVLLDDGDNARYSALVAGVLPQPQPLGFGLGTQGLDFFRIGDVLSDLTGVLHWSWAGDVGTDAWRIRPVASRPPTIVVTNERSAAPAAAATLRVASLNAGNFFATIDTTGGFGAPAGADSAAELERQTRKLVAALAALDAAVIGLVEVENDGGYALQFLANQLNAQLGGGFYDSVAAGVLGNGATTVGLLYDTRTVRPRGAAAVLTETAFTSPNGGEERNHPALAQTFERVDDPAQPFTVVVTHLVERDAAGASGADLDQGDGQGAFNDTRRRGLEHLVGSWLATDPTGQAAQDLLLLGTLGAYAGEAPIAVLKAAGYTNLIGVHAGDAPYTVATDGVRGYVDHAFATGSLAERVVAAGTWAINADEAAAFDYNDTVRDAFGETSYEVKPAGRALFAEDAYRASAHDPVFVDVSFSPPAPPPPPVPPPPSVQRGDVDGDGDVDQDDLPLVARAMQKPAAGVDDPRDVNGDGTIGPEDLKRLRELCTRPKCRRD
jgi:predicted extracellular nuclease